jgi:sigma-B regulation protein RsbU (phosphoserine phosphatase)
MNDKPVKILVVEDNPGDARLLEVMLTGEDPHPFQLTIVPDLARAVERLGREPFDLTLLDLSLPDASGIESLRKIREKAEHIPVIVLSGLDDEYLARQAVHEGAQDYLVKDRVERYWLLRAIRHAIERQSTEDALEKERNVLRTLIDSLPDKIFVKDAQGRYVIDNVAHSRFVGAKSQAEVTGKTVYDFFPKELADRYHEDDQQIIRSRKALFNREEPITDQAGNEYWVSTSKVPVFDPKGEVVALVAISRDVTQRRRAEAQLARYAEELRAKNEQMQSELNMACEIQMALLPQTYPTFPHGVPRAESSLHFAHYYHPASTIGGDFFDVMEISDTLAGVIICDVMGHGVRASLITAILRALVEELRPLCREPGRFLSELNRRMMVLLRQTHAPTFASAFYLLLDIERGVVRYASAGHPCGIHLQRSAGIVKHLDPPRADFGPVLGLFEDAQFHAAETVMEEGDFFMLYTDGLYEVPNSEGVEYGREALLMAVKSNMNASPPELFENLMKGLRNYAGTDELPDDVCMLGIQVARASR